MKPLTVHWCFFHARREWSDEACSEVVRWTAPDGTQLMQPLAPRDVCWRRCQECDQPYQQSRPRRLSRWCSDACRMRAQRSAA